MREYLGKDFGFAGGTGFSWNPYANKGHWSDAFGGIYGSGAEESWLTGDSPLDDNNFNNGGNNIINSIIGASTDENGNIVQNAYWVNQGDHFLSAIGVVDINSGGHFLTLGEWGEMSGEVLDQITVTAQGRKKGLSSDISMGLLIDGAIPGGMEFAIDNFNSKNAFNSISNEIKYLKWGTKALGNTINALSIGLDAYNYNEGNIGNGKFAYRMTGMGASIYAGTVLSSGGVSVVVGGMFQTGELMYDANRVSMELRLGASSQQIHHGRINNTNVFSQAFWTEVGGHLNFGGMMNGLMY